MNGYEACTGCGICTISCPVWWETRDVWFTPHGRARALQGGATAEQIADSVLSCKLCGACEAVCPEEIGVISLVRELRTQLHEAGCNPYTRDPVSAAAPQVDPTTSAATDRLLLAGSELESRPALLANVVESLGGSDRVRVAADDGRDLAWAFESGAPLDETRLQEFLAGLAGARERVVIDGALHQLLRQRAVGLSVRGLAEMLLDGASFRAALGARDLFVIEPRAFHVNHSKLVRRFARLRAETGCQLNLDLQRVAIPSGADSLQAGRAGLDSCAITIDWMLEGRDIDRIVVESPTDLDAIAARTALPVVHLSALVCGTAGR